jgi:hypothetical protein
LIALPVRPLRVARAMFDPMLNLGLLPPQALTRAAREHFVPTRRGR